MDLAILVMKKIICLDIGKKGASSFSYIALTSSSLATVIPSNPSHSSSSFPNHLTPPSSFSTTTTNSSPFGHVVVGFDDTCNWQLMGDSSPIPLAGLA
eukprot:CAMPEP_0202031734 /NCGR_PEP_ID=MMETSP0905-20130828/65169_1 /ASSEMBLY_ACC=CAM_ASM_000554 /TAXON_ID=420261 /ORGANISM="Thalassiosira antarctica, Strain CCMP982" /LENGTH=97 /DNA_ID=CAMNT_0048595581 /DNA_START=893 /DNA_END=1183 /DNA_ORIENTATION=-